MSYRPMINREQYHDLEVYWFRLLNFINSVEFKDLETLKRRQVLNEFNYMFIALDILGNLFNQSGKGEVRVVAWRSDKSVLALQDKFDQLKKVHDELMSSVGKSEIWKQLREVEKDIERISVDNHIVYHFSCLRVAGDALSCNHSKVSSVCQGHRPYTGGYVFMYEQEYLHEQPLTQEEHLNKLKACPTI